MKKLFILLALLAHLWASASTAKRIIRLQGAVLEHESFEPLNGATIEVLIGDSIILEYESDELGSFEIFFPKIDTYNIAIELGGYHSQYHEGLVISSYKVPHTLDLFLVSNKKESFDLHCGERCWCINYEHHDWFTDTLPVMSGVVMDEKNKEPLPFVHVWLEVDGEVVQESETDFDGRFFIDSIPLDSVNIRMYFMGYSSIRIKKVPFFTNQKWEMEFHLYAYRPYRGCGYRYYYEDWTPPPIDLFAEEQRINDSLALVMPSTEYEDAEVELSLIGYPNPFRSTIQIDRLPENENIQIVDIMGMVRQTIPVQNQTSININLERLQKGLYFIHYEENGQKKNYAIVKK